MANQWFRLYSKIMNDPKIEMLSFEDQRHFVWLLCMKNEGYLDESFPNAEMFDRMVARKLGLQGEALDNAKRRLIEVGLIDDDWQPIRWNDLQFISDQDPTRAERQARHREKKRNAQSNALRNAPSDGIVTPLEQNRTEPDTEQNNTVELFEFWKTTLHHEKAKLDDKRERAIRKALKLKYSIEDLKAAIVGCSRTPFNMGQNQDKQVYDDITLIFRDSAHIEAFIKNAAIVQPTQEPANRYRVYGAGNKTTRH